VNYRTHLVATGLLLLAVVPSRAHYHILLPPSGPAATDKPASFVLSWGHPFEHELFDTARPEELLVLTPDGKQVDLTKRLKKTSLRTPDNRSITGYTFSYTPQRRGDHMLILRAAPVWMKAEGIFLEDTVKVVLHVATQRGWDNALDKGFELVPLTRPYGLRPGTVFQAQALVGGKALPGARVEVERYNPAPPKELPPDELITGRLKTDPNGVLTCTLADPGWWCVTVERQAGERERDGKKYPVKQRSTLWVFVDAKPRP
jgi:nickel transport protein